MKIKGRRTPPLVDSKSQAELLNRYVAYVTEERYDCSRGQKYNHVVIERKRSYAIQWENIKADIKGLFANPFAVAPRVAFSMAAFLFIFAGLHEQAKHTAFDLPLLIGAVSYDAAAQTSHSGEPATINWNITIGSGNNRLVVVMASGLSGVNDPTFDGNATSAINTVGNLKSRYYLAPGSGSKQCSCTGGNIKVGAAISFADVDQTDPIGATNTEDGSASPNGVDLTTEANDSIRVDVLGRNRDDSTTATGSLDVGTLRCNPTTPQNQFRIGITAYTTPQATAGAATATWTTNAFNRWYSAFEIKAAPVNITVNDERAATLTGTDTANSERAATMTGGVNENSERAATVHGIDTINSERPAVITGKETANSERGATLGGTQNVNDERAAVVTGTATANSERPATLTGAESANAERGATLVGNAAANAERGAKIAGVQSLDIDEVEIEFGGVDIDTSSERSAVVTGKDTANSERGAKIHGTDVTNSERPAVITGKDTANSERGAKVHGLGLIDDERGAWIRGVLTTASEVNVHLWGKETAFSERGGKLHGIDTIFSERGAKITGRVEKSNRSTVMVAGISPTVF